MKYFLPGIFLISYFEILGQYIIKKFLSIELKVGFGIGLLFFLAYTYLFTSLVTSLGWHFVWLIILYGLFFVISILLIIKDRKKIKYNFSIFHIIILCLLIILIYFSLNTDLGHLHGFDTTNYLNLVTGNAQWGYLNNKKVYWGSNGIVSSTYTSQTFYYFASFIVFIFKSLFNFYASTTYIWSFQILFYVLLFSLIINSYEIINKKRQSLIIISVLFFGFYIGKLYFNSVFGFYGNSYRYLVFGYISLFLYLYFKDNSFTNKLLITTGVLAACSVSSSSLFMSIILMFVVFIINVNNDNNIIKWICLTLFLPLINLGYMLLNNYFIVLSIVFILELILIIFSNKLMLITRKYKLNIFILILSIIFMVIMSYRITGNLFDFNVFFNNASEIRDMTINYFNFSNAGLIRKLYVYLYIICLLIAIIKNIKDKTILIILFVFLIFLNPLCCSYLFKMNYVYHRTYDIIFNPFIYMYLINSMLDTLKRKEIEILLTGFACVMFVAKGNLLRPYYYTQEFIPSENFNMIFKMDNDKLDVISKLKEDIDNNDISRPKIVTHDLLTQSVITNGIYIYGRNYLMDENWTFADYQVYAIFYQETAYDGFYQPKDADIKNVEKYIKEAKIDYLVLDREWSYEDPDTGEWQPLIYKIDEFKFPFYENEKYAIYHFDK